MAKSFLENETCLGHGALGGIHQEQDPVSHLQDPLHLPAEVGVTRSVDQVDLDTPVGQRDVLGKNGDPALPLEIVGVEDALTQILVAGERIRFLEQLVDQGRLPMVNVRDDCDITDTFDRFEFCTFSHFPRLFRLF